MVNIMKRIDALILALLMLMSLSFLAWAEAPTVDTENTVPSMLDNMIERIKANPRTLVFTEGTDTRILEAATRLNQEALITPVLIGNVDEVTAAAVEAGFDIEGLEIIDPATFPDMDRFVDDFVVLRKGKTTEGQAREMLLKPNYFGTMLVKEGFADALLGGATYSTADTVRPALQLVKTREGANLVSSCMILIRGDEKLAMGDCAINVSYEDKLDDQGNVILSAAQQVAEVAVETARTAMLFGIEPKIAMLSFSTNGSAKGSGPEMMREAASIVKETHPELPCDGEMQFDAAVVPEVGQLKFPGSPVAGYANTFIFPEIQSGNIGYKIAQRLGDFMAIGPILQGLNAPINDLSRGCTAEEVYLMSIITAAQSVD
jgi:phosphate acetyltransferase